MLDQVYKTYMLLSPDTPPSEVVEVQRKVMEKIVKNPDRSPPQYGKIVYITIAESMGVEDPYKEIKKKYNDIALSYLPESQKIIDESEEPIKSALLLAAMGNSIDFGASHKIDMKTDFENFESHSLEPAAVDELKKEIEKATSILVLGDNCGEIVFDKLLLETIKKRFPDKKYYYAVRGGPTINDITIDDAIYIGMDKIVEVVKASQSPGIIYEECSPEFQKAFDSADVIISKGQGNFESLVDYELKNSKQNLFFLLKLKCKLMEVIFRKPLGTYMLINQKNVSLPF